MEKVYFKIKNKVTGQFWQDNWGGVHRYNNKGRTWATKPALHKAIRYALERMSKNGGPVTIPPEWEIVTVKKVELEVPSTIDTTTLMQSSLLMVAANRYMEQNINQFSHYHRRFIQNYLEHAAKRGDLEKIQFILLIKSENPMYPKRAEILEAREQLRNLGVKTRSFREYYGMFVMYDRDQAFRAKMTLDLSCFLDLDEVKKLL